MRPNKRLGSNEARSWTPPSASSAGRTRVAYYYRKNLESVLDGIEKRKTDTGKMMVSSVELTALDLVRYAHAGGGIDNIATVLADLGPELRPRNLAALSVAIERPVIQRLGHLLDYLGHADRTGLLFDKLSATGAFSWVELDSKEARHPEFTLPPKARDERWRVIVRRTPEVDERSRQRWFLKQKPCLRMRRARGLVTLLNSTKCV